MRFRNRSDASRYSANVRWRAAAVRADNERTAGLPDREPWTDVRRPFELQFAALGWRDVRIEPRLGYISWRCVDVVSGEVLACKALGEMLRWIAGQVPRQLGQRNFQ